MEKKEKRIIFWLHRVLEEKCKETKEIQERISILNHQIQNFDKMHDSFKEEVFKELDSDFRNYDWKDALEELKDNTFQKH